MKEFSKICQNWLDRKQASTSVNSYARYRTVLKKHIMPFFKDDFALSVDLLHEFLNYLHQKEAPDSVVVLCFQMLKSMLIEENNLYIAPFMEIKSELPTSSFASKKKTVLNSTDLKKLEYYVLSEPDRMKIGMYLCKKLKLTTTMICAVTWEDIDLEKRKISINKIVVRDNNSWNRKNPTDPKTVLRIRNEIYQGGDKVVTIPKKIAEVMAAYEPDDKTVYFISNSHKIPEVRIFQRYVKEYLKLCGIEK